ncbi:MAG: hypothetical protein ACRCZF_01395 [Gemmataceae bacterium]
MNEIEAVLYIPGQKPQQIVVRLDQLHTCRSRVSRTVSRRRNLPGLIAAMADPHKRGLVPLIELQRLGEKGQPRTTLLRDVVIHDGSEEDTQ